MQEDKLWNKFTSYVITLKFARAHTHSDIAHAVHPHAPPT